LGKHRCLGSHLHPGQMRAGLRAFLTRVPDYHLISEPDFQTGGNPRSPKAVHISWPTGHRRVGTTASTVKEVAR
jgi:cytochrome P450